MERKWYDDGLGMGGGNGRIKRNGRTGRKKKGTVMGN